MPMVDAPIVILLGVALASFLLGSIPFGLVVARVLKLPDPRTIGSGNIGATNVLRTGSKAAAIATVLLDGAKGLAAVVVARAVVGDDAAQVAALCAFLGHCYSVFLGFKGGKGVATFLGALFGLSFALGAVACLVWLATCIVTRYSSLSALIAAVAAPVAALLFGKPTMIATLVLMATVLIWRHRENIARLRAGAESKVGTKSE